MFNLRSHKTLIPFCLVLNLSLSLPVLAAPTDVVEDVVGEMITVIGQGKVITDQGEQIAARGKLVHVGDRIETAAGGHVHVRFVDGALVSVRPLSRLHIENYRNSGIQTLAAIKFKLEEGVIRSVTGHWGEANRDRFRLNTPVAAIGIKGTDFIVKASGSSTLASVNSGAIVMAPLEGACASGLGPCAGSRTALLSADMQGKMLEYLQQNDTSAPRLIPYADLLARSTPVIQITQQRPTETNAPSDGPGKNQASNTEAANQAKTAAEQVVAALPVDKSMVWLHNKLDWNIPANTISTRFDAAGEAGRNAVIGNFFVSLYRDEITTKAFTPPTTSASFNLLNASANYSQTLSATEAVSVSHAKLSADFAHNTLSTQMNLSSPSLGQDQFAATASITPQGIFVSNTASQKISGAFSNDARQAGFLFEKSLNNGTVSGLTLWGR